MRQDEMIKLAREAGFDDDNQFTIYNIERFAALVAAHEREKEIKRVAEGHGWTQAHWTAYEESIAAAEREACAKFVDHILKEGGGTYGDAIRARGEK